MKGIIKLVVCACLSVGCVYGANINSHSEEGMGKNQRFRFDPEANFTIIAYPGVPTDIQLSPDEHVTGFALGDTVQWVIEELPGHIFIKPMRAELFTAGTLVTDRHTYQLAFKSTNAKENWMQRVSWTYPDLVILRATESHLPHSAERVPFDLRGTRSPSPLETAAEGSSSTRGIDPNKLYMDYLIQGDAPFRPITVFDDGRSMWIKLRPREALPAVFEEGEEGNKLVHYAIQDDWIVLPRLIPKLTLKIGANEIHISRKTSEDIHANFRK
jgi:type IV secretion system protein TrbG